MKVCIFKEPIRSAQRATTLGFVLPSSANPAPNPDPDAGPGPDLGPGSDPDPVPDQDPGADEGQDAGQGRREEVEQVDVDKEDEVEL